MDEPLLTGVYREVLLVVLLVVASPFFASAQSPNAWINEFHYDNDGEDTGEFVEIVVEDPGDYALSDIQVTLYNGSDGASYYSETLDNFTVGNSKGNYTIYTLEPSSIQNGAPDGIALSYQGNVIAGQFLSYEGVLTATDGVANGASSTDIEVEEPGAVGESLQLTGTGLEYSDFTWQSPAEESPGSVNEGQFLHPTIQLTSSNNTVAEDQGSITISVSITKPDGNEVTVDVAFQTSSSSSASEDFVGSVTETLTFPSNAEDADTQDANFIINNDSDFEGLETAVFTLTNLSTSGGAQLGSPTTYQLTITDNDQPNVVINEVNADPGDDADGSGDGTVDTDNDEFVEILNNEPVNVDISNWDLEDAEDVTHTFANNTILKANEAIVVFDDAASPAGSFGGSLVVVSDSDLSLNNDNETVTLKDASGNQIDSYSYTTGADAQSMVRTPDGTGGFTDHTAADTDDSSPSSPGTKIDGSNFTNSVTIEGTAGWRMLSSPVDGMDISDITDDTPIQGYPGHNDGAAKNFYTGYDGSSFTGPTDLGGQLSNAKGFILYFYNNDQAGSSDLPVILDATTGSEHTSDVTGVSLHSSGDGWNLLGNPFETAIDVSDIGNWVNGGSLASQVGQIWDSKSGSYITTTANNNKVESWQGFFVQNTDASSIDFPVSAKTSGTNFYRETSEKGFLAFTLRGEHSSEDVTTTDKAAVLYFHQNATHEWDSFDISKLLPMTYHKAVIGFTSAGQDESGKGINLKAQESRPFDFRGELSFDMQLQTEQMQGDFELSWAKNNLPDSWIFTLIDNVTGTRVNMNNEASYDFTYSPSERDQSAAEASEVTRSLPVGSTVRAKEDENSRFTVKVSKPGSGTSNSREIPESVKLNPNYPNPFNPNTTISFELTEQAHVTLNVYTIVGQRVATLVDEVRDAGEHDETWNASDMPSGIYIVQLEVQGNVYIRKMTLIK